MPADSRSMLEKTTEAVNDASQTVQATAESVASAIEDSRRPGGVLDQLSRLTRKAPLRSLAVAFALGLVFARRR